MNRIWYNRVLLYLQNDHVVGFTNGVLKACCGCGGPYNYSPTSRCGDASTILCDEPDTYVSWDGVHFTEAAYKMISKSLFQGPYTKPEFNSLCLTSTLQVASKLSNSI